jgi:hypothetical protein
VSRKRPDTAGSCVVFRSAAQRSQSYDCTFASPAARQPSLLLYSSPLCDAARGSGWMRKVLVVDDHPSVRARVCAILEKEIANVQCTIAGSAAEAIQRAEESE